MVYNRKEDRIFCMPEYLVAEFEGVVHTSSPTAVWKERPELTIIGKL